MNFNTNKFSHLLMFNLLWVICFTGCKTEPEPINFGTDQCHYCKMSISDPKFGAELVTSKGRIYKFDAVECMINHINEDVPHHQQLLAIAYDRPRLLFPVDSLSFIQSSKYRSPMGENLAAFYDMSKLNQDEGMTWREVYGKIIAKQNK